MRPPVYLVMLAALAGCGAPPPPPPPPTVVNITLVASADVNDSAPLSLRVYQLGTAANFNNAEFFQIYKSDAATLGSDVVKREDIVLAPGATKTDNLMPDAPVKAIGFFAAYRDYTNSVWRGSADVPAHMTTNITVTASAHGISVKSVTLPPPAKPAS